MSCAVAANCLVSSISKHVLHSQSYCCGVVIIIVVELVKFFCAHHMDGHLQAPVKKPTAVFDQQEIGPQSNLVSNIGEKQYTVTAKN